MSDAPAFDAHAFMVASRQAQGLSIHPDKDKLDALAKLMDTFPGPDPEHRIYVEIRKVVAIDYPYGETLKEAIENAIMDTELYEYFPPTSAAPLDAWWEVVEEDFMHLYADEDKG